MNPPEVLWPPDEKVKLIGALSRPQVLGVGIAFGVFGAGIAADQPVTAAVAAVPVLLWTMLSWRGQPIRTRVNSWARWHVRSRSASSKRGMRTRASEAGLQGFTIRLAHNADGHAAVGVIEAASGAYTVVIPVDCASLAFLPSTGQAERFDSWGDLLGGLCVEPGSSLTAERIAWSDIHRASDPTALAHYHRERGIDGAASSDYAQYVSGFGAISSSHQVLVAVTLTRARSLRLARQQGFTGTPSEVMHAAVIAVGRQVGSELTQRGFDVGAMLSPAAIGRMIVEVGDPFQQRGEHTSAHERFSMRERTGPNRTAAGLRELAIDGACHRVFSITWPRTKVSADWLWKPLGMDGPKVFTVVFEPIAPSRADARREALTTRAASNNTLVAISRGRVRTTDRRKTQALQFAEQAVAAGHQELDGYGLVVVSARTPEELNKRCETLRQKLRETGRAGVRELTGQHDVGFAAALPLGIFVKPTVE
jgi:hypothetical protein